MIRLLVVACAAFAVPCAVLGQAQPAQPPKPAPEIQQLAYYVGTWKTEGEITAGPQRSGFKFTESGTCEWFAGGFHLICRHEGTRPSGSVTDLSIMAYDAQAKGYTYFTINSLGDAASVTGVIKGHTLTYAWNGKVEGKPAKFRYTEIRESATSFTFKTERSIAGGPWRLLESGKSTKVK